MAEHEELIANYESGFMTLLMDRLLQWLPGTQEDYVVEGNSVEGWVRIRTSREDVVDADLQVVLVGHGALVLGVDQATINADGVDMATITCSDAVIAGDANVYYVARRGGEVVSVANAQEAVVGGTVSLEFSTSTAGTYLVEVARQGVSEYETGYVVIEAV